MRGTAVFISSLNNNNYKSYFINYYIKLKIYVLFNDTNLTVIHLAVNL